ncbi:hypothetical protein TWF696_005020 [Orbilia brochopaga]|uniref:Uncharacterized protein n=1 Tax=Orbilia brochopaga TaxID=3140254 RepID=A0AAV9V0P9_9PEZI
MPFPPATTLAPSSAIQGGGPSTLLADATSPGRSEPAIPSAPHNQGGGDGNDWATESPVNANTLESSKSKARENPRLPANQEAETAAIPQQPETPKLRAQELDLEFDMAALSLDSPTLNDRPTQGDIDAEMADSLLQGSESGAGTSSSTRPQSTRRKGTHDGSVSSSSEPQHMLRSGPKRTSPIDSTLPAPTPSSTPTVEEDGSGEHGRKRRKMRS